MHDELIEACEVKDCLTLPRVTNYIEFLVCQSFTFERAVITSSSDKDNWQTFSGHEKYPEYETFLNTLKKNILVRENRSSGHAVPA